jgi:hypothetical protein
MCNHMLRWIVALLIASTPTHAAEFLCQNDVPSAPLAGSERKLVDQFWAESLIYLRLYLKALETPTGQCMRSAEAVVQTDRSETGEAQKHCILEYRDVQLMAKHIRAILSEPSKAKTCFDAQKNYKTISLYTPSAQVRQLSATSVWINRPLLTDYYRKMGGTIGASGTELNENFVTIASRTATDSHWSSDVGIKGLPTLWSSVGWIPMYAENPQAGSDRFRGGYLYAEMMGPWGNLRIAEIDGEKVGAEIGMTVQLSNTFYPYHYHHPQEVYMTLTRPQCVGQNKHMIINWDSSQFKHMRKADGWTVEIDGSNDRWKKWFVDQDSENEWLTYSERNAVHAFDLTEGCNETVKNTGLVTVWARSTSRDNEQATRFCRNDDGREKNHQQRPGVKTVCKLHNWNLQP